MSPEEAEIAATDIADRASRMRPEDGDELIRTRTRDFPPNLRYLIRTQSAKLAELQRDKMDEADAQLKRWGCGVGITALAVTLLVVIFIPEPSKAQWIILRLIAALGGAAFSSAMCGFIEVRARWQVVAVTATGGMAVFFLTYFWNPASLDSRSPLEELGRNQPQASTP